MAEERPISTFLHSDRVLPRTFIRPALRFFQIEASSGVILLVAAVVALVWANSAWWESYEALWDIHFELSFGAFHLEEDLGHLINDGFMAIFFFVVGLEIKRELVLGELRDPRAAALPAIAALGGMIVPALIYVAFVGTGEGAAGWGIPMATDIAFSLGVVALLGRRVPVGAKLFLLALAIADDVGAILVIALFYTTDLSGVWLALGILAVLSMVVANRVQVRTMIFYVPVALAAWYFFLESGVHATLAGVAIGLITPARPLLNAREFDRAARRIIDTYPVEEITQEGREHVDHEARVLAKVATESIAPLNRLEHALQLWSGYVIVPVFALANAGVRFEDISIGEAITHPIALGVAAGLVVGKIVGISAATWAAVRFGIGKLPKGTTWSHVVGLAALAGIGFTVALFIAGLAFPGSPELGDLAKTGIFAGSLIAGLFGYALLRWSPTGRTRRPTTEPADAAVGA